MYAWILLLCAPCLASALDKDAVFEAVLSRVSSILSDPKPLPDMVYKWSQRSHIFWQKPGVLDCTQGNFGPLPLLVPSAEVPTVLTDNVLRGTAVLPRFEFKFDRCSAMIGGSGSIEPYPGYADGASVHFSLTLQDSERGCRVKLASDFDEHLQVDLVGMARIGLLGIPQNEVDNIKAAFEAHIVKTMNTYLSLFKEIVLPERCPSS